MVTFWQSKTSLTVLEWVLRAVVMYAWLLLSVKIKGQREIGRLNAFDFIVAVTFGSIAASVLNNPVLSLRGALTTIATLVLLDVIISYLTLKNSKFRRIVQDEPLVIVQNGRIIESMMRKARINIGDLLLELRQKKVPNLHDVEFAILEPNGRMSVIPKSQARPVKPSDLQINTAYEGMPTVLIEDGNIKERNLEKCGLTKEWLLEQIHEKGFTTAEEILIAHLDTTGRLYLCKKNQEYIHKE